MKTEDLQPDIGPEEFDVFATEEQKEMVVKLKRLGWMISHLWEYEQGHIGVWLIAAQLGGRKPGYVHCYLKTDGSMHRYETKTRIGVLEETLAGFK